jgi:hypothetical protein
MFLGSEKNAEDDTEAGKKYDPFDNPEQFEVMKQQKDIWEQGIFL